MEFDTIIIGAGPAGLSTAIKLAQLNKQSNKNINICVLEKGAEVGSHIISGAIFETKSLTELVPNWKNLNPPIETKITKDNFLFLTKKYCLNLPIPQMLNNNNNYIISLSNLCKWLAKYAENLGIQIFPGFAANKILYNHNNQVIGVETNSFGIDKNGNKKSNYQEPMKLLAKNTVFAEGCRGHLSQQIINKYRLNENSQIQTYGLGIKEIWKVPEDKNKLGNVIHTIGWPLNFKTYGGSFIYYLKPDLISIGFVIGLDYKNPYIDPFYEFQKLKTHPKIKRILKNGNRISYGAKTLNEGGYQSIPKLNFPGGLIVGCSAGFLNVAKIKGSHTAIKSGIIAAECIFKNQNTEINNKIKKSWINKELYLTRNIRPSFNSALGIWGGLIYSAFDLFILKGKSCWTFKHNKTSDNLQLEKQNNFKKINYPKPDNLITFDKLSSVKLSNTMHTEDQPIHLKLKNINIPIEYNLHNFDAPETKYCPANVYEIIELNNKKHLQINFTNCLHCKACDIKDPKLNITWTAPEGGGGPNYIDM